VALEEFGGGARKGITRARTTLKAFSPVKSVLGVWGVEALGFIGIFGKSTSKVTWE
jgi:hypothetical protein